MILKRTSFAVAVAALILGTAAALRYAQGLDLIGPEAARRTMQVMIGLILAAYSNLMPKDGGGHRRWPCREHSRRCASAAGR